MDARPLGAALTEATERLAAAKIASPRVDAELMAAHIWDVSVGRLRALAFSGIETDDDAAHLKRFAAAVAARARRVPLQHITGTAPFRGLDLAVGPGVFIPRPETEITAAIAIEAARQFSRPAVVDLGTGSGAIALAVALEVPAASVWAVELDPEAYAWARRNLAGHPVTLVCADATALPLKPGGPGGCAGADGPDGADGLGPTSDVRLPQAVDVVVSNPPYIPDGKEPIDLEVALYDPPLALYGGGADGLRVPDGIVGTAARWLRCGGVLVMEHGAEQGAALRELAVRHGFIEASTLADLAGRDRVLRAVWPGPPGCGPAKSQAHMAGSAA